MRHCILDYDAQKPQRDGVLKMRGSAHITEARRLMIEQGGLRVERVAA